ncbi:MAG TPA: hypothetical protein VGB91_05905 [Rhizomicrobium sp.]
MVRFFAILLAVAGTLVPAAAGDDAGARQIAAGRLEVMMSESRDLQTRFAIAQVLPAPAPQPARALAFDSLVLAVLDYNVLSFQACQAGTVASGLCRGPYLPPWLSGKADDFTDMQLEGMIADASGRLMPFWDAVCAGAGHAGAPEPVCPME